MDAISRRTLLKTGAATAGLSATASMSRAIDLARAVTPRRRATLDDIEHVVVLMQENRSFDHYFGSLRGVRGFGDPKVLYTHGNPVWRQPDDDPSANPSGYVLPFRLNTQTTSGQAVADQSHAWIAQHLSWDQGQMDGFVTGHRVSDSDPNVGFDTMGYYTRADIPYQYALADAFTICDAYHCSVFGPTNPNRIMSMSGMSNPEGGLGGPCADNSQVNGQLQWTSYPERLQKAGISWYVYQENDNDTNNMLPFFAGFNAAPKTSPLYLRGNTIIPTAKGAPYGPALWSALKSDVMADRLPQVSWILASSVQCEHPSATPSQGAYFTSQVLAALASNPKVWAKTVLFYTYDENDGFFDHVPPPTPPANTPGEWVTEATAVKYGSATFGNDGPVGLGFRVPMTVISPFSMGGVLCDATLDHTSMLRFLERKFGVIEPNISLWRRDTVGDLTEALGCFTTASFNFANLPNAQALAAAGDQQTKDLPAPTIPSPQAMATQETGTRPTVGSLACPTAVADPVLAASAKGPHAIALTLSLKQAAKVRVTVYRYSAHTYKEVGATTISGRAGRHVTTLKKIGSHALTKGRYHVHLAAPGARTHSLTVTLS